MSDELNDAPIVFGLEKQGHLPVIKDMLERGATWREIGNKIGWCPATAREHYERYCWEKGTWQSEVLPTLAGAIGLLLELAERAENKYDSNRIHGLALQARKHLKGSTPSSDYYKTFGEIK